MYVSCCLHIELIKTDFMQILQWSTVFDWLCHMSACDMCTYGVTSKFGYGSARGDPDVWIGLDHLRFGMDRGYGSACGFRVWIGALHFDSQPYLYIFCQSDQQPGYPPAARQPFDLRWEPLGKHPGDHKPRSTRIHHACPSDDPTRPPGGRSKPCRCAYPNEPNRL